MFGIQQIGEIQYQQFLSIYDKDNSQIDKKLLESVIEVCDHVFVISDLCLADSQSVKKFEKQPIIKIWEDKKVRKNCEICENNFAGAVYTYSMDDNKHP